MSEQLSTLEATNRRLVDSANRFLKPLSPITAALDNIRNAAEAGQKLPTEWPKDRVYVATDALISVYTQVKQMQAQASGMSEEEFMQSQMSSDAFIVEPSILSVLHPWCKTRSLVRMERKEFSSDLDDINAGILAKIPQWSLFFDLTGHDITWDEHDIVAVGFARYFFGTAGIQGADAVPEGLEGECGAVVNNLISIFLDTDGNLLLGPYLPLSDKKTVKELLDDTISDIMHTLEDEARSGEVSAEQLQIMKTAAIDTKERTEQIFKYLVYFLSNLSELKDPAGNGASLAPNPTGAANAESTSFFRLD